MLPLLTNCCSPCCACCDSLSAPGHPGHAVRRRDEDGRGAELCTQRRLPNLPGAPPFLSCLQVILGTQYAGEMKKGVFSLMNYVLPKMGILSLHSGCNEGKDGDVTLFFGLSGARSCRACVFHAAAALGLQGRRHHTLLQPVVCADVLCLRFSMSPLHSGCRCSSDCRGCVQSCRVCVFDTVMTAAAALGGALGAEAELPRWCVACRVC